MVRIFFLAILFVISFLPLAIHSVQNPDPQYVVINPDYGPLHDEDQLPLGFPDALIPILGRGTGSRKLAFTQMVSTWHPNGTNAIGVELDAAFAKSESLDLPLFIQINNEWFFWNRPDLWNWFNSSQPGYNPANKDNVEWSDWNTPVKSTWLNWGQPLEFAPRPCFESVQIRNEISSKEAFIAGKVVAWQAKLQSLGKPELFAGITGGQETSVESIHTGVPPQGFVDLGYCALTKRGFSANNPPANIDSELEKVVADFAAFEAKTLVDAGISKDKVYTHIWGAEGLVLPNKEHAPLWAALNNYSNPGFSLFAGSYNQTAVLMVASQAPKWAIVQTLVDQLDVWINKPNGPKLMNIYNWGELIRNNPQALDTIRLALYNSTNLPPPPNYAVAGDYDGDRKTDRAVWRPSDGTWYVQLSGGNILNPTGWGTSGDIPVPGDYNGDGKIDFAVWRPSDGNWYIKGIGTYSWGTSGDIPVPGDYDRDGKTDLAVFRRSDGTWWVYPIATGFSYMVSIGAAGDTPVPGDHNGDGQTDIAIWRSSNGVWLIPGVGNIGWGTSGDIPVPGDYNGDGKTDLAVYRPSNNIWYIERTDGTPIQNTLWGTAGDIPVPGDYNGDGKTEIAMWRPSDGNWYIKDLGTFLLGKPGDIPVVNNVVLVNPASDTAPPTVSITSPTNGTTVSGVISISATASDNVGVVGVQFKTDGVNLGAEDTTLPYSIVWNTSTVTNGSHTISAIARDAAGNTGTSTINVVVNNTYDLCTGVTCNSPPAPYCSGSNKISYINPGVCSAGMCSYSAAVTFCKFGCSNGQCNPDPCAAELTCNNPPAAYCSGSNRISYNFPGTCSAGVCSYTTTSTFCQFGCSNGLCTNDPCAGVTCNNPPTNYCSGNSSISYNNPGTCSTGVCSYSSIPTSCTFGCSSGRCNPDPCASVVCTSPPAAYCSGSNRISYNAPGTCNLGTCSYTTTTTACQFGCSGGLCINNPCNGVVCNSPPQAYCSASTRIYYSSAGTCNNQTGSCSYTQLSQSCQYGCANGQCNANPCAGITCNVPPVSYCSGNNLIKYSTLGVCTTSGNSYSCSYTSSPIECQYGCANGTCNPSPCVGVTCNKPPASYCDGNVLVTYNSSGVCTSGICNYVQSKSTCIYGCDTSSCLTTNITVSQLSPFVSLNISPQTITISQSSKLSWSAVNATLVIIEPGIGTVNPLGSLTIIPESTLTYTLTAYNQYGSSAISATVHVVEHNITSQNEPQKEPVPRPAAFNSDQPSLNIVNRPIAVEPPTHGWPDFGPRTFPVPETDIRASIAGHYSGEIKNISAVGDNNRVLYYTVETGQDVTIFFFFHVRMKTYYYVEPNNLTVVKVEKPFWSFLAW